MDDLFCIMPVVHLYMPGARGKNHGNNYEIIDPEQACVMCAMWQVLIAHLLLKDLGARARKIVLEYKSQFESKAAYLSYVDSLNAFGDRIVYREDGTVEVNLH